MKSKRRGCQSGVYHVVIRGVNRQVIFECVDDYRRFLRTVKHYSDWAGMKIYAWVLMENHVHLLLKEGEESLSDTMHRIGVSYVKYFNKKNDRVGPLYQGRFFSGPVEDVRAFWRTYKYIAQNPVKAGVASSVEAYRWSWLGRANEGVGLARTMMKDAQIGDGDGHFRTGDEFNSWLSNDDFSLDETKTLEMEATTKHGKKYMNDAEAQREIERLTGMKDAREFMSMNICERERAVKVLVEANMSPAQISRLTGMNRSTVYRVGKRG